jgi:hypothetical protein
VVKATLATAQLIVGAVPALVAVVFTGLIALAGLAFGPDGRQYALDISARLIELAAAVTGVRQ